MLQRLEVLKHRGGNFAFETTLAARHFGRFLRECQSCGYTVNLIYFWLVTVELAIERVQRRVESGGHNIPVEVIRRRYQRGRANLLELYLPLSDRWIIYDNSSEEPQLVAERPLDGSPIIYQSNFWQQITEVAHE
jgi:predicted ABC-type ATPase